MNKASSFSLWQHELGSVTPDIYNTSWVALVPRLEDPTQPAWPQAVEYIRSHQLEDGGWGEPYNYYAHDRTICTLAALRALLEWNDPRDERQIARGIEALHRYAPDLQAEPHEPVGFELLLPKFVSQLERFELDLPMKAWADIFAATAAKVALVGGFGIDYDRPRSWWFSMELLSEPRLVEIDERVLNRHGSIVTSPAATAAFLRAYRRHGRDSVPAANFLQHVVSINGGGAGVCEPIEQFELVWKLDSFMRAGLDATHPKMAPLIRRLTAYWNASPAGLKHSQAFPIPDGDHTAVGYHVLRWAGLYPAQKTVRRYWDTDHYRTYADERLASVSANVHALTALRHDVSNNQSKQMAIEITEWLRQQMDETGQLQDKWHFSPLYPTSRAIPALMEWDDSLARRCLEFVLAHQHESGGWGTGGKPSPEETSYAVLGLVAARRAGLLRDGQPLRRASTYLQDHSSEAPKESLWIGKALYQPIGVVQTTIYAARVALAKLGTDDPIAPRSSHPIPESQIWTSGEGAITVV